MSTHRSRPARKKRRIRLSGVKARNRRTRFEQLEDRHLLAVLFSDSFENGQWDGNWGEDSQNDWFTSTQRSTDGSYSAEVDGSANNATLTMANPVDLSSQSSAELTYSWYIESGFDSGEYLAVDLFDGSTWTEFARLSGNVDADSSSPSSAAASAIASAAKSGSAQSMLRRAGAKLTTTTVTDSPTFITLFALRGAGSAISRSGT